MSGHLGLRAGQAWGSRAGCVLAQQGGRWGLPGAGICMVVLGAVAGSLEPREAGEPVGEHRAPGGRGGVASTGPMLEPQSLAPTAPHHISRAQRGPPSNGQVPDPQVQRTCQHLTETWSESSRDRETPPGSACVKGGSGPLLTKGGGLAAPHETPPSCAVRALLAETGRRPLRGSLGPCASCSLCLCLPSGDNGPQPAPKGAQGGLVPGAQLAGGSRACAVRSPAGGCVLLGGELSSEREGGLCVGDCPQLSWAVASPGGGLSCRPL